MTQIYIHFTHLEKKDVGYVRSPECNQDWYCWWRSSGSALVFAKSISYDPHTHGSHASENAARVSPSTPCCIRSQHVSVLGRRLACTASYGCMWIYIIGHARIKYVGRSQSCMVSIITAYQSCHTHALFFSASLSSVPLRPCKANVSLCQTAFETEPAEFNTMSC